MFKKTITFEDFNGVKQTQDFYFHLSKGELVAMAANDSIQKRLKRITEAQDGGAILEEFRQLIRLAVGVRSEDGARFIKDDLAKSQLLDSPAFDEMLMELATNTNASVEFVQQLIPEKLQREMADQLKIDTTATPDPFAQTTDNRPAYQKEHRKPTTHELHAMTKEQLTEAFAYRETNQVRNGDE